MLIRMLLPKKELGELSETDMKIFMLKKFRKSSHPAKVPTFTSGLKSLEGPLWMLFWISQGICISQEREWDLPE